jgi:hypothetical protein
MPDLFGKDARRMQGRSRLWSTRTFRMNVASSTYLIYYRQAHKLGVCNANSITHGEAIRPCVPLIIPYMGKCVNRRVYITLLYGVWIFVFGQ